MIKKNGNGNGNGTGGSITSNTTISVALMITIAGVAINAGVGWNRLGNVETTQANDKIAYTTAIIGLDKKIENAVPMNVFEERWKALSQKGELWVTTNKEILDLRREAHNREIAELRKDLEDMRIVFRTTFPSGDPLKEMLDRIKRLESAKISGGSYQTNGTTAR